MVEEYVSREEFNNLKEEVQELKQEMSASNKLLSEIDKKIDIIYEKISNGEEKDELKLAPIKDRVTKLENNQDWLKKTLVSSIIGLITTIIGLGIKIVLDIIT